MAATVTSFTAQQFETPSKSSIYTFVVYYQHALVRRLPSLTSRDDFEGTQDTHTCMFIYWILLANLDCVWRQWYYHVPCNACSIDVCMECAGQQSLCALHMYLLMSLENYLIKKWKQNWSFRLRSIDIIASQKLVTQAYKHTLYKHPFDQKELYIHTCLCTLYIATYSM